MIKVIDGVYSEKPVSTIMVRMPFIRLEVDNNDYLSRSIGSALVHIVGERVLAR